MAYRQENLIGSPGLRLVQLYLLLCTSGRTYTLARLAGLFRCSRQTILRMTEQLQRVEGAQVETWLDNKERFFRASPKPAPENLMLDPGALRQLAFCSAIVRHLLPDAFQKEIDEHLGAIHPSGGVDTAPSPKASPWVKGAIDYTRAEAVLRKLQSALLERHLCALTYQAGSAAKQKQYLAAPLRIIAYREALYLRCRLYDAPGRPKEAFRTFAIHRIVDLRPTKDRFTEAPENNGARHFGFPFHEPLRVRAAFWRGAAGYVGERSWSSDQTVQTRRDGSLILEFTTTSRLETVAWILGFGPDAELIEPADLRAEVRNAALAIAARYGTEEGKK